MEFSKYQKLAHKTAIYPKENGLHYTAYGLFNEVGEIAGKVKKWLRGDYDIEELKRLVEKELGDGLWYFAGFCTELGLDLNRIACDNVEKLRDRQERGVLRGSGDER